MCSGLVLLLEKGEDMAPRKKKFEYTVSEHGGKGSMIQDAAVAVWNLDAEDEADELRGNTRLSGKNQITLPVAMVRTLGWHAGDEVDLMIDGEEIWLRRRLQGKQLLDRLEGALSHVPEWQGQANIDAWVRRERDSWDREWDSDTKPSRSESEG